MRRLSGLDAAFLFAETPSQHMHVSSVSVLRPSRKKKKLPFTRERLIELIGARMYKVPSLRERLATVPFGVHHPLRVDDPEFDIECHIRSAAVVSPGGDRELAALAAEIISRPLDPVSNVPGPQIPLYSLGAKMLATYPLGPISEGAALNVTVNPTWARCSSDSTVVVKSSTTCGSSPMRRARPLQSSEWPQRTSRRGKHHEGTRLPPGVAAGAGKPCVQDRLLRPGLRRHLRATR